MAIYPSVISYRKSKVCHRHKVKIFWMFLIFRFLFLVFIFRKLATFFISGGIFYKCAEALVVIESNFFLSITKVNNYFSRADLDIKTYV